jgi:hypothetical protein
MAALYLKLALPSYTTPGDTIVTVDQIKSLDSMYNAEGGVPALVQLTPTLQVVSVAVIKLDSSADIVDIEDAAVAAYLESM